MYLTIRIFTVTLNNHVHINNTVDKKIKQIFTKYLKYDI